jgi:hypothetical protein
MERKQEPGAASNRSVTLINAIRTYNGRLAELEFKLRGAWRKSLSQSDYGSVIADVG